MEFEWDPEPLSPQFRRGAIPFKVWLLDQSKAVDLLLVVRPDHVAMVVERWRLAWLWGWPLVPPLARIQKMACLPNRSLVVLEVT